MRNDPNLRDLNMWYRNWARFANVANLRVLFETRSTNVFGIVVKPDSSDPGIEGCRPIPIDADHDEESANPTTCRVIYTFMFEHSLDAKLTCASLYQKEDLQTNRLYSTLEILSRVRLVA